MTPIANRLLRVGLWALTGLVMVTPTVHAAGIDSASPLLPPAGGVYLTAADVHAIYDGPGLQIVLSDIRHSGFSNILSLPIPGGTQEFFDSNATGDAAIDIGPDSFFDVFFNIALEGPTSVVLSGNYNPGATGTFPTEMVQLDLVGNSPFGPVRIRESPSRPSVGQTSITPIGGGMFHIDSFFDIFTELSLDGGASWIPSNGSVHVELVPEPSSIALCICGAVALAVVRGRRLGKSRKA